MKIPEEGKRRMWSITQEIEKFYDELWKLHEDAALSCKDDEIALKVLNAIDDILPSPQREQMKGCE